MIWGDDIGYWNVSAYNQGVMGYGRLFTIGEQAVNFSTQAFYNAVRPNNAPDWNLRAQLAFLFPK